MQVSLPVLLHSAVICLDLVSGFLNFGQQDKTSFIQHNYISIKEDLIMSVIESKGPLLELA